MLDTYQRVVVTGGLGFIGRHLAERLIALGKQTVVMDNGSRAIGAMPPGGTFVDGDVRDAGRCAEVFAGADLVFHTAANASGTVSITDPRFDFETNAIGTFNAVEAAVAAEVGRFVYVSSASVYGRPQRFPMDEDHPRKPFVPYGATKLMGELACLSFFHSAGLPVVIGRPFCVYGPGENPEWALVEPSRYLRWHLNDQPIRVVGDAGRKTRDFVHVTDVVEAFLLIADRGQAGEAYNVGSGEETSMAQLADAIGIATNRPSKIHEIREITEDTYRLVGDIAKLETLGYRPRRRLTEAIREIAEGLGEFPALPHGETIFRRGQHAEEAG